MNRPLELGKRGCDRVWEVEAARDGRLTGESLVAFERHRSQCVVCREEAAYIEQLAIELREMEVPEPDEVGLRRLRQDVLSKANAELLRQSETPSASPRKRMALWIGVAAALVMTVVGGVGWKRLHRSGVPVEQTTKVDTTDQGGAKWTRRSDAEVERIELHDGTLRLHVERPAGGKRVLLGVPDGEIEDLGTTFQVVVTRGETQRVAVEEGRVILHLTGAPSRTLLAGDTWERQHFAEPVPAPSIPAPLARKPALPSTAIPSITAESPQVPPAHAAEEDAAYLRAVRLLREGKREEARDAAKAYLRRFPDGFRREEIGKIAN